MKILVTGGTGFLGRHVVWRFSAAGANVIFTGRDQVAANDVQRNAATKTHWLPLSHGTPGAEKQLANAAEGADVIVHCAALSTPWGRTEDFQRANIDSTAEVLAACRSAGVRRLVHVSTPSLYFEFSDRLNIRETATLPAPVNEYARTKGIAEELVRARPATETVILRPRALFGPWDQTLMPRLLRVMRRGALPLMRGGMIQLDLTYIDNAVDAVVLAATKQLPRALATYNVSNGEPQELRSLLDAISRDFGLSLRTRKVPWPIVRMLACTLEAVARLGNGKEPLLTQYSVGVLAFSQTLDISALQRDFGYEAKVSIREGIRRHAKWWREQPGNAGS
jgi:nucleoside-diphosphate-sugar epimerase